MIKEITYVTGNNGKYEMVRKYLATHSSIALNQVNIDLIEEQSLDLKAIAISKAHQAWNALKKPIIVDDSGIYFHRYNQFPGSMTKFIYLALGFEGLYRLYEEGDRACFITYLVFMYGPEQYQVFEGKVEGTLIKPKKLSGKFDLPYQHLLVPEGSTQTVHEISMALGYSSCNSRIVATQKLVEYLEKN